MKYLCVRQPPQGVVYIITGGGKYEKIVRREHSKENPVDNSDIDFTKPDKLTDEEVEKRAKNDPDAPASQA